MSPLDAADIMRFFGLKRSDQIQGLWLITAITNVVSGSAMPRFGNGGKARDFEVIKFI